MSYVSWFLICAIVDIITGNVPVEQCLIHFLGAFFVVAASPFNTGLRNCCPVSGRVKLLNCAFTAPLNRRTADKISKILFIDIN